MTETLLAIGVGLLVYTLGVMALAARGALPSWVSVSGPVVTLERRTVPAALERLAARRRLWRRLVDVGVVVAYGLLVLSLVLVLTAAVLAVTRDTASAVNQPHNVVAVPGVNDFLPLAAAPEIVFGLFVGVAVHEVGHALLGRVEGVDVASMGMIFLTLLPFGAYVDMDGNERETSTASQHRIYAAGVSSNLVLAVACTLLLVALAATSIAVVPGLAVGGVLPGTPADEASLERGDVLTAVDGTPIEDADDVRAAVADGDGPVTVELADGESVSLEPSVVVTGAPDGGPNAFAVGSRIDAVDGTPVRTTPAFRAALENASAPAVPVTLRDADGRERSETLVGGAAVAEVVADGPLARAGAPAGDPGVVTAIDGDRVYGHEGLFATLENATAGETVGVEFYTSGHLEEFRVSLGASPNGNGAYLGVVPQAGIGGLALSDLGVDPYPAAEHLAVVSGGGVPLTGTVLDRFLGVTVLPVAGSIGLFAENFGGFVGAVPNFYTVTGPLSVVGGLVLPAATVLFWTGWISLLVGVFNCLPVYPLDGGRLVRTAAEAIAARLSVPSPGRVATAGTALLSGVVALAVVTTVFGPMLLGS
ncbi:site-2 protease family protein [Halopiger goleimassiliensis]|uniref:site-2 protease family protein n=1 Tax=Halopiger goleimassiliensis TaxID=1293048 RepID=UPI000677ADC3|nr:site-2 protease family protein [Halopiger goleimassiliensis]